MLAQIKSYENAKGGRSGTYIKVKLLVDGKELTRNVFEENHINIIKEAFDSGQWVEIAFTEKNEQGYENVQDVELAGEHLETVQKEQKPPEATKSTPRPVPDKDRDIRRAVALKAAVEFACGELAAGKKAGITSEQICVVAEKFENWLNR